ncbi:MAG: PolC-type DNA polymerase III [Alicyclobacillus sp. RIFOXYA1_FULL_53_8]|nr:MAG: PolC-type DNA polymerase III [Alicyclobacillus sp. RIFOXYA1_FULL_53_8]
MSQPESLLPDESTNAQGPIELQPLPPGTVEKVIVKPISKQVEVHFAPPFSHPATAHHLDPLEPSEQPWVAVAQEALERFYAVSGACERAFAGMGASVRLMPPASPRRATSKEVRAAVVAVLEAYALRETVTGNWLKQSDFQLSQKRGDLEVGDGEDLVFQVTFIVRNETELQSLQKRDATGWITDRLGRVFGYTAECDVTLPEAAEELQERFRQELFEAERKEVNDMVQREQEQSSQRMAAEAATAEKSSSERGYGERYGRRERKSDDEPVRPLTLGRSIDAPATDLRTIVDEMRRVVVQGRVFSADIRTLPSGRTLVQFNITDESDSITAKLFVNQERQLEALKPLQDGIYVRVQGQVQFDTYQKELVLMIQDMEPFQGPERLDLAERKRVELHLHTPMSALDGVTPFSALIKQAAKWGHQAIAVTDHGVVQAFPEAYELGKKHGVKVLLGVEAYVVDDGSPIVYRVENGVSLEGNTEFVVFDTETTGLNAREDTLIEIAAVRVKGGQIIDTFATLIDPERSISAKITELTGISPEMVEGQPKLAESLQRFREFAQGSILVAHNAEFDVGFLGQSALRIGMEAWTLPVIDTLSLARALYPGEKNYRLKTLTQKFSVELVNHHRALADSEATAKVFLHMLAELSQRGFRQLEDLNQLSGEMDVSRVRPFHATILVKNQIGLRNLYELVSLAHTKYLFRQPRIPRSELVRLREGLVIGTACQSGELIQAFVRGKTTEEIEDICKFYDYLEIQPPSHYENLIRDEILQGLQSVRQIQLQIVAMGKKLNKPVVATGDVHFLGPNDSVFREVFLQSQGNADAGKQPPLYLRTTEEMLAEFEFLGADRDAVVVDNPRLVVEQIDDVKPIPDDLYTPVIEGAEEEIRSLSYTKARRLYGEQLPGIVEARLQKELNSIINNGFSVIYLIAQKLVTKSLADGYLVGSRGSVGSSLVATMTDITEVNPLPPHYVCPACQYSEFFEDGKYGSGYDLPAKDCPKCGEVLKKDGQDIPFETFLGFEGDKVPDIDLNFSGDYQPRAHRFTEELFGKDHVFRAGTISTVAEKTAYGYVRKFSEERGLVPRNAELDRLVKGCTGIKRTSGQHPGGQMVVPSHLSIYDFSPVQYPADDKDSGTLTTHFDYHSISGRLLKLDILGHDDPTVIRMLQDLTGIDPENIPLDDSAVLALFSGTESLGVKGEDIRSSMGTYAIPEFGTKFVRQMLEDTRPTTFSELVRISGLSHGTDVWLNNAQELIRNGKATLSEVICARDDIMVYLIYKGLEPGRAFKIMESIRKGKGVKDDDADYMRQFKVPEWYIESGRKIKYMFPKAHAAAYVLMAVRIAWFKVHHPLAFYATYYTVRADDFDVALMAAGRHAIVRKIEEIEQKGNAASPKEKSLLTVMEVALEMVMRGFKFLPIDLYQSHATQFLIKADEKALLPPFAAIPGVGDAAAKSLFQARDDGGFLSVEDLQSRSRVSKTVIEILDGFGCLKGMPETNQLSLF